MVLSSAMYSATRRDAVPSGTGCAGRDNGHPVSVSSGRTARRWEFSRGCHRSASHPRPAPARAGCELAELRIYLREKAASEPKLQYLISPHGKVRIAIRRLDANGDHHNWTNTTHKHALDVSSGLEDTHIVIFRVMKRPHNAIPCFFSLVDGAVNTLVSSGDVIPGLTCRRTHMLVGESDG